MTARSGDWDPSSGRESGIIARLAAPSRRWPSPPTARPCSSTARRRPSRSRSSGSASGAWQSAGRSGASLRSADRDALRVHHLLAGRQTFAFEGRIWDAGSRARSWSRSGIRMRGTDRLPDFLSQSSTPPMASRSSRPSPTGLGSGISPPAGRCAGPSGGPTTTIAPRSLPTADSSPRAALAVLSRGIGRSADHPLGAGLGPGGRDARGTRRGPPPPPVLARWPLPGISRRPSRNDPNSTVRIWDLATGREVRRFEGHRGAVNAVAFTPDGRSVVSGSEDATALVWDISDLNDSRESGMRLSPEVLKPDGTSWPATTPAPLTGLAGL